MIQKPDPNARRILSFPAVQPCEAISPATLLTSLTNLSHAICNTSSYETKSFATQKKIAREAIRQVKILHIFFEEVRDHVENFSDSIILCFSELHFILQKLQFLLGDCGRQGSKVWILIKSKFVVNQFRDLIRSAATALDVLPLDCLVGVSGEVKELVELVAKQARKARFEVNCTDAFALEQVNLILNQFERRFEPERWKIKRVLDYLEIRKWSDCDKEVKFLDQEVSFRCNDGDEREVPLLSSLMAFMCYCRGVIFEELDFINSVDDHSDEKNASELLSCLNPEDFRCPISLELMTDPVTVSTGQTYGRSSIEKWLKSGNLICPKTGEKLTSEELVPNAALKSLIQQICAVNGVSIAKSGRKNQDKSRDILSGSPAAGEIMKFLLHFLAGRLTYGTDEQKNKAAYEIRLLAKSNIHTRSVLVEVGAIPPLLNLLTSTDSSTQENAIAAVLKLSKDPKGRKAIIDCGGLLLILLVLRKGLKPETRQIAAATIFYLAAVDRYRRLIGATEEAIPALVEFIKDGSLCGKRNAIAAILGLLLYHGNRERVLAAGLVPVLVDLIASLDKLDLVADSLAILASIVESIDGSIAILQTSALHPVMGLLQSSISRAGKEYCVSILLSLCINGGAEVVSILAKEPSIMPSLYSLITDGTSNASKKARALLNMLHKFHESSSSRLLASAVGSDKVIRAG